MDRDRIMAGRMALTLLIVVLPIEAVARKPDPRLAFYICEKEVQLPDLGRIDVRQEMTVKPPSSEGRRASWDFSLGSSGAPALSGEWGDDGVDAGLFEVTYAAPTGRKGHVVLSSCGGMVQGCDGALQPRTPEGGFVGGMRWSTTMALAKENGKLYFRLWGEKEVIREDSIDAILLDRVRDTVQKVSSDVAEMAKNPELNCDRSDEIVNCGARGPCER